MADWSELPADLLQLISQHLPTSIDILRFRSVCCTWRAAAPPPPPAVFRSPRLSFNTETGTRRLFYLYKSTVYLLQSFLAGRHSSCIIKLGWSNPDKMHLLHPIAGYYLKEQQFPKGFPKLFDFSNIRVRELGAEYKLRFINYYNNQLRADQIDNWLLYKEKVAVLNNGRGVFVILAIHSSGKLMMYKSGDGQWSSIHDDFPNSSWYDDVILWRGKFYALDNIGRIVVVNVEELKASVVAKLIISDNSKKVFVGSDGELLLVDKYLDRAVVKMRVYRLDVGTEIWTEISDLGNQIVFWGPNRAFLVSAGEIFGDDKGRGNFIFYNNVGYDHGELNGRWDGAYDLENGSCMRRTDTRIRCSNMFLPPLIGFSTQWMI